MRTILKGLGWVLVCAVVLVAVILGEAHLEMRRVAPPLPEWSDLDALRQVGNGPSRVRYVNTASQAGSGPATVAHPAFVLEWSDGRSFLIDAGMDREYALEFGRLGERVFDGEPIVPHGSVTEQLGPAAATVRGIAFTHLHSDHTNGLHGLCDALGRPLSVFQTPWQADRENYTTRPGKADLESADCARLERLAGGPIYEVPGFPGLVAVAAGGHTPGSTLFAAYVGDRIWVFAGDVTNFMENLRDNRPKPAVYSIVIPEARDRLERLRTWLRDLDARDGFVVLVSHDRDALEASGMEAWQPAG